MLRNQVVFEVMTKFQAKYKIRVDREQTYERAYAQGLSPMEGGGRPTKGDESRGQLILTLKNGATVVFGPKKVQVYWSGEYEDVGGIEEFLNGLVAFEIGETKRFDFSTREDVPTHRMYKKQISEMVTSKAEVEKELKHKEWKLEVIANLEASGKIRNRRTSDFIIVNTRLYLEIAQFRRKQLMTLLEKGVENGWECDDRVRTEIVRLGKIIDARGRI
jgi:hypothetical protein